MQIAKTTLTSFLFCLFVALQADAAQTTYTVKYRVRQAFRNPKNIFVIRLIRKGADGKERQRVEQNCGQSSRQSHTVRFRATDIGTPTHISIGMAYHNDTFEMDSFEVVYRGKSYIADGSLFTNSQHDLGTLSLRRKPAPPKPDVKPNEKYRKSNRKDDPHYVPYVVFFDNRGGEASDAIKEIITIQMGEQVGYVNTKSDSWDARMSLTVGTEGGIPGLASVNLSATAEAGFQQAWTDEKSKSGNQSGSKSLEVNFPAPTDAVRFTMYKVKVPWTVQDVKVGGMTKQLQSLNGRLTASVGKGLNIPSRNHDGSVQPRAWREVAEMLAIMRSQGLNGTADEIEGRKENWIAKGWVYEGETAPKSNSKTDKNAESDDGGFLSDLNDTYQAGVMQLPEEYREYAPIGVAVLGLIALLIVFRVFGVMLPKRR